MILALEAAAGDETLSEDHAAGEKERARLTKLLEHYGRPANGSSAVHVMASEAGWVAISITIDIVGRLMITSAVS